MTFDEKAYHQEWLVRKGRRTAKQAAYADIVRRVSYNGFDYLIKRAYRSAGHQSNYELVPKYFVIISKDGVIINGFTMTEKVYKQAEINMDRQLAKV